MAQPDDLESHAGTAHAAPDTQIKITLTVSHHQLTTAAAIVVPARMTVDAAEIKVLSAFGIMAAMEDLAPKFEKGSGPKLIMTFDTANAGGRSRG